MKAQPIIFLAAKPGDLIPTGKTRVREYADANGMRIIGIQTIIPAQATIIQGGLSSPFWLEADGECGVPGIRIEPPDPRK
jgi:hypothetical protein